MNKRSNCIDVAYLFNDDKYYDSSFASGIKYFIINGDDYILACLKILKGFEILIMTYLVDVNISKIN